MSKTKLINLKVSEQEYQAIKDRAKEQSGGNVSKWLREAGRDYKKSTPV